MSNKLVVNQNLQRNLQFFNDYINANPTQKSRIESSLENKYPGYYITPRLCLDITEDKGGCSKFITYFLTDEKGHYKTEEKYKIDYKDHKKGDFKYKSYRLKRPLYNDLVDVLMSVSDMYPKYRQACAGSNHYLREVTILDVDANKYKGNWNNETNKPYGYLTKEEAKKDLFAFIEKYQLPKVDYFIFNKESGNFQAGWFHRRIKYSQDFYPESTKKYLDLKDALAFMWGEFIGFPGDKNFKGWQIKNPFCKRKEIDSEIYFDTSKREIPGSSMDNFDTLMECCKNYIGAFERLKEEQKEKEKEEKKRIKEEEKRKRHELWAKALEEDGGSGTGKKKTNVNISLDSSSRNYYEVKEFPKRIWEYMRSHNNEKPDSAWLKNTFDDVELYACRMTGKPNDKEEIEKFAVMNSVYRWSVRNYKSGIQQGGSYYSKEQLENAKMFNQVKKYSNYLTYLKVSVDEKLSLREIASKTGLSKSTVHRYSKMSSEEKEKMLEYYEKFHKKNYNFMHMANSYEIEHNKYTSLLQKTLIKSLELHELKNFKLKDLIDIKLKLSIKESKKEEIKKVNKQIKGTASFLSKDIIKRWDKNLEITEKHLIFEDKKPFFVEKLQKSYENRQIFLRN